MNFYGFYRGEEFEAYQYLGAHREGKETVFRTFAPAAAAVSVIGEFNGWSETPMQKVYDGNFWECRIADTEEGQMYKYRIHSRSGRFVDHADPYAFYAEHRPGTASRLYGLHNFHFTDAAYQKKKRDPDHSPMNIYEIQAGSWRVPDASHPDIHYNYRDLADRLIPYLTAMHYDYVELMPVTEYPSDESWGYQTTGFFAPTSRYGTPDDLKYLIDRCHAADIGVILDFVAVHFAANDYGLREYDGTALYEYPNNDVGRSEWGTCNFMHSRGEVRSFLQSSVWYWIHEFHFDGVRIDAVSNLIYWQGDASRGENKSAISFLQTMNAGIKERCPNALLIAEDSSSWIGVTKPVSEGGLGFDYKWDLGWMNDTFAYMQSWPFSRKDQYHKLTFSIFYYYNEKYLLPISHDEVVHGKATVVNKMNGSDTAQKFAQARILFAYMYAHPGKKLNFMGNELGGPYEYSEKKEIDWWLLRDREENRQFHRFMKDLNAAYAAFPALWAEDYEQNGFEWTDCQNEGKNAVYSFVRRGRGQTVFAVFNFDGAPVNGYEVRLPDQDLKTDSKNGRKGEEKSGQPADAEADRKAEEKSGQTAEGLSLSGSSENETAENPKEKGADITSGRVLEKILDSSSSCYGGETEGSDETAVLSCGTVKLDLPAFGAQFWLLRDLKK